MGISIKPVGLLDRLATRKRLGCIKKPGSSVPQRLVYVVKKFPKFSETFIASELVELQRRNVQFRVLALCEPEVALRHRFIREACLERATTYGAENFDRMVEEFRPELLHAHFASEATAHARRLAHKFALPFTFTAHGYDIYRDPPADFRDRARGSAALITVSMANARYISRTFRIPLDRIQVIPSGVDMSRFRPALMRKIADESQASSSFARIACVARYEPAKNLELLVQACAILRDRGVRFHCVLAGEGDARKSIEKTVAELELCEIVELKGAIDHDEVIELFQTASVAVLSSNREGMPVSLMEAGACGIPVVATSVGGVPELIEHEITGFLSPPGEAQSLADNIERLLMDPELRARMGDAARRRIEEKFSLKRQVDKMLKLWSCYLDRGCN